MLRRQFVGTSIVSLAALMTGCRHKQYARVVQPGEKEMVGSHAAGQETYKPLIDESVAKLLSNCHSGTHQVSFDPNGQPLPPQHPGQMRICFVGVENKSAEEIGDFKEQIYQLIDSRISSARDQFVLINRRYVDSGLKTLRIRPDDLFVGQNMRQFVANLEQEGQPFDYLLWAVLTSGTTHDNKEYQRDYLLTLELVDIRNGQQFKESATLSKGYHQTKVSRWSATNPLGLW